MRLFYIWNGMKGETDESRATLGSRLSAVLVAAGSAVGLGNIWRFPAMAGDNGGGAFLLLYILCVIVLGLPLMLAEFSVGRASRRNAVGAYRKQDRRWSFLGYNSVLVAFLILGFYYVVSGWTLEYFVHSVTGTIGRYDTPDAYRGIFENFRIHPWRPTVYAWIFVLITHGVIALGVRRGIERSAKFLMPLLFVVLVVLAGHSLLMPGGDEGVRFLLRPDFSKVTPRTVLAALGQAFFSLSIGMGCMITYASYFNKETDLRRTAVNVAVLDTVVALLAGLAIFPAAYSAGIFSSAEVPTAGPDLVFITLPALFNSMAWGGLWAAVFFLLLVVAALTSTLSLHEVVTAYLHEEWCMSRKGAAGLTTVSMLFLSALASLSLGMLSDWRICGLTIFDSLDFLTANILMPVGGLLTSIFVGWRFERRLLRRELGIGGRQRSGRLAFLLFMLRWVCPAILLAVFLDNLGLL